MDEYKTVQTNLYGESFVHVSLDILREHEPQDGYYLAFSGGKDSIVVYDLAERAGVEFDAHFNQTTIDPPEVLKFIKENYPDVIWEKPKRSMFAAIRSRQIPPSRVVRYCCAELKEIHGVGRVVITGVRREESASRRMREEYEMSRLNKNTKYCNPIVSWSSADVWGYIKHYNLPYPSLYDEGYDRIGCIMCPLQNKRGILRDALRYPRHYNAYMHAFEQMLVNSDHREDSEQRRWKTAEDVMFWYIYGIHRGDNHPPSWKLPTETGFVFDKI